MLVESVHICGRKESKSDSQERRTTRHSQTGKHNIVSGKLIRPQVGNSCVDMHIFIPAFQISGACIVVWNGTTQLYSE